MLPPAVDLYPEVRPAGGTRRGQFAALRSFVCPLPVDIAPIAVRSVGIASRRSGVARRWKRHHSNGDDSNAVESNGIATAVAKGSWQRRLGILS